MVSAAAGWEQRCSPNIAWPAALDGFFLEGNPGDMTVTETTVHKLNGKPYYDFGHHPANRFEFTRGRDLVLAPGPASGPINFLAYPLLEIDGKPQKVRTLFLFRRTACDTRNQLRSR